MTFDGNFSLPAKHMAPSAMGRQPHRGNIGADTFYPPTQHIEPSMYGRQPHRGNVGAVDMSTGLAIGGVVLVGALALAGAYLYFAYYGAKTLASKVM